MAATLNRMESTAQLRLGRTQRRPQKEFAPSLSLARSSLLATNASAPRFVDEKLQRLEQLASLGTLSAGLAHEIKNAMVAIRTFVEMLMAENKGAELAGVVQSELLRIDSIISQMLRCSSQPKPSFVRVRLSEVLDRSLRLIEPQLRARNIRLMRSYRAAPDTLQGDAHQLEQAFLNLFLNAFDAIGQDGKIIVRTTKTMTSNRLQVLIQDTGIGIAKGQLSRLFEPFYTTKANGTGLGLPITRGIIELHYGDIRVQSQPHKGTTFQISLPLA